MKQERETEGVVELGCVSTDTQGGHWVRLDSENSLSLMMGLTDD